MNRSAKNGSFHPEDEEDEEYDSDDSMLLPPVVSRDHPDPDINDLSESTDTPKDKYNIIYIIFLIQGVGMLLPWNFFITARDYFFHKFQKDSYLQNKFENAFALASMFPNVISICFNIFLTNKLPRNCRVITCLGTMFILFAITASFTKIDTQNWPEKFFAITICCIVVINTVSGVYQGTMFGLAGIVGQQCIQGIMSGQAMAGVFAALADLISKLISTTPSPLTSAFIYFLIATCVIAITAFSYSILFKVPTIHFYLRRFARHSEQRPVQIHVQKNKSPIPYWLIFKQISPMALSVMSVFCVTLTMFPAVLSKIESVDYKSGSRWTTDLFPTLVCFLLFNAGDWAGRVLAGQIKIGSENGYLLPILCLSRVIFIPLILMCNVKKAPHLPFIFKSDFWPVIINFFFSMSNGYFGSLCMMFGPKLVAAEYVETAGTIMSMFLSLGLTIGACISFAF